MFILTMNLFCILDCFKNYDPKFWHLNPIWIWEGCETWARVLLLPRMRAERGLCTPQSSQACRDFTSVVKETSPTCCSNAFCWHATGILSLEASPWVGVSLVLGNIRKNDSSKKNVKKEILSRVCHYIEHWLRNWAEMVSYKASPSC